MANGGNNLPDVPSSWNETLKIVKEIVVSLGVLAAAVGGITGAVISGCNNAKVNQVQQHQEQNAAKLDAVKDTAVKVESKIDSVASKAESIEKKTDAVKSAMPPK